MKNKQLIQKIVDVVVKNSDGKLVSLYILGSFATGEMTSKSDIDINAIFKPEFKFKKEQKIAKEIKVISDRAEFAAMSYDEFFGGRKKGTLTNHMDIRIFLNFLKTGKLIYGKKINFEKLSVKPASSKFELKYHIRTFNTFKEEFKKKDTAGINFQFRDFIKTLFYIASKDMEISENIKENKYSRIAKHFGKNHVVGFTMTLRKKSSISKADRIKWIKMASAYVEDVSRKYR